MCRVILCSRASFFSLLVLDSWSVRKAFFMSRFPASSSTSFFSLSRPPTNPAVFFPLLFLFPRTLVKYDWNSHHQPHKIQSRFFRKKQQQTKQKTATQINLIQRLWVPLKHPNLVTNQRMLMLATGLVVLKVKRGKRKKLWIITRWTPGGWLTGFLLITTHNGREV